jgi:hypothetical protein
MALDPRSVFSSSHPLAGKIAAGIRTTENRARNAHQSMQMRDIPVLTLADRAQQMFGLDDKKGTRVYYAVSGVFNTVDERGKSINFIRGLFKTTDRTVMRFLQQFVEAGNIHYLELQEDATADEHQQRSEGGNAGDAEPLQQNEQASQQREEPASVANRSGAGGEDTPHPEQPINGPAIGSQPGDGNDSQGSNVAETPKKPSALDLLRKGK